ncbi:MAG: hypothetical protein K2X87_32270 [Gemmataceae bacterium]|nr:hypothetical protein [Gemmataceae bacterium]
MNDVLERIWARLRCRLYPPSPSEPEKDDEFDACVVYALHDCQAVVAEHYLLRPETITAFFRKQLKSQTLRIDPDGPEYLVDFTWTTYPKKRRFGACPLASVPTPCRILLACESEAGLKNSVLKDFVKLVDIKSEIKVMVYRGTRSQTAREFLRLPQRFADILRLRTTASDSERWLFVGVPYYVERNWPKRAEGSGVQVHVLGRRDGDLCLVTPAWADYESVGPSGSSASAV